MSWEYVCRELRELLDICDECDIRHTCTEIVNRDRLCICDILDMMKKELNIK